jgi:hypothetical protein
LDSIKAFVRVGIRQCDDPAPAINGGSNSRFIHSFPTQP